MVVHALAHETSPNVIAGPCDLLVVVEVCCACLEQYKKQAIRTGPETSRLSGKTAPCATICVNEQKTRLRSVTTCY